MHLVAIINPAAAHGRVGRRIEEIRSLFRSRPAGTAEIRVTEGRGHATELAHAVADRDVVVAVGGDGTVHEVALGLLGAEGRAALGIVPVGTGNDLAHALGYRGRPADAVAALDRSRRATMDCGMAVLDGNTATPVPFFNNVGLGFDALASFHAVAYKHLPGPLAYGAGVLRALTSWTGPQARIEVDGAVESIPLMFATVANGTRTGGLFRLTPGASLFDGVLDVCTVRYVRPARALLVAPRTLNGSHVRLDEVRVRTGVRIRIDVSEAVPVHADGEIVSRGCRRMDCWVVAGALPVLVPSRDRAGRTPRKRT